MPRFNQVPCVNMQQFLSGSPRDKLDFVDVVGAGLKEFGFLVVEGHGVDTSLIRNSYSKVQQFFALPTAEKEKFVVAGGGGQRGYTGFGKEHAKNSNKGDLKEFWHVGREAYVGSAKLYPNNIWADAVVPDFQNNLQELYEKLDGMAATLLSATSLYLDLPANQLPAMAQDGNSILRCIHYPPVSEDQFKSGAVRAAAHEDINLITILCEATESGLELLTRNGKWMAVESGPGQMVVDSGDMLSRVCNNQIPSTTHRVVNPPGARNVPRFSMPFFVHPFSSCKLEVLPQCQSAGVPPKYAPITADEFLQQRLREIGLIDQKPKI
jgi:isopenicillin N synthase-like dioxygenase